MYKARTSLQRLLQLNEAGRSLEECLNDAAQILAFEKSWDDLSIPTRDVVAEDQLSHKRPEWLLHWILEKLNSQPNAYNSARAWIFLWRLLPLVPKSILARNLIASKFLDSVEKALASDDSGSHDPAPCRTIVASSMVENETSSQSKGEISRSRKRKRGSSSPSPDPNGAVDSSSGIRGDPVLVMLSKILEYLVDLVSSDAKDTGTIESQHLNAVFQTSFNNAVRIMHHWQLRLLALSITITDEHRITLSPILYILGSAQDLPTNQSSDMLNIFAEECLVTSMRLFRDLMPATLSESADLFDSSSSKTSSQAEQALAKYVLLPARSRYLAATREKNNADKEFYSLQLFEPFLRPFQSQLLLDASSFGRYSAELRSLLSTIPQLWRLAIQIVPRSTPKRRSAEEPWLRALFVALAEYSGSSITGDWSIAVHPHSAIVLGEMLDVCSEYSISLTPSLLESIVRRYSGMCLSEEESIYWSLVAKVLRLDATVFLPGRPSSPLEFVDDSGPLHQLVLRHLSSMPWKDEFDPFNPAQKTTDAVQRQKSAAAFFDLNGMTTAEFRASLPISLMQAYARNRILSGFLDVWRRELIKSTRHIVLGSGHSTIWEDQDFAAALRQLLESSLTEAQIHEELTKYGQPFEELEETQNILYIFTELRRDVTGTGAAANIVLLDALIGAIKTDSVVEASRDRLLLLYRNLIKIGSKPAINKHNIMFRIWRIISGVRRLLDPLQAQDELQSLSKEAVDSACFHAALDAVGEAHRNLLPVSFARAREGLRFALRVSSALAQTKDNALKDQFVPLTEMFLNISFDWVNPKSESAPLHWYKLEIACILVEHGFIFNILDSEHRQSLFRGTFHLAEMSFRYDSELPADAPRPHADVLDALYDTLARSGKSGSREDYFNTLLQELTKENRGQHTSDTSPSLTEHVSKIHGRSFPRSFVEQLSDRLLERLRSPRADPVDASQVSRHLALLLKMMGLPHGCSRPGMNVDFLQILGRNTELEPTTLRKPFEQVVRKMLENEPSGSSLRENILPLAKSELIGGNGYERGDISIGALSMVLAAIPFSTIQDFDLLFRPKDLDNWLQRQLDAFVRDPGTIKNEAHITLLLEIIVAICRLARQPYSKSPGISRSQVPCLR